MPIFKRIQSLSAYPYHSIPLVFSNFWMGKNLPFMTLSRMVTRLDIFFHPLTDQQGKGKDQTSRKGERKGKGNYRGKEREKESVLRSYILLYNRRWNLGTQT